MKLYIGGISPEVTDQDLLDLFSQFGKIVKVDLLKDPETSQNRGYAFVEMESEEAGESAILSTNNTLLGSTNIQVSKSRSRLDQKRERQQKHFKSGPRRDNRNHNDRFRKNKGNESSPDDNKYNRKDYTVDARNNRMKKGVDYGRSNQSSPQMSFLGQEGFAQSARTIDPLYPPKRESNPNYKSRRNGNFKHDKKTEKKDSLFSATTSDIIGNLE